MRQSTLIVARVFFGMALAAPVFMSGPSLAVATESPPSGQHPPKPAPTPVPQPTPLPKPQPIPAEHEASCNRQGDDEKADRRCFVRDEPCRCPGPCLAGRCELE